MKYIGRLEYDILLKEDDEGIVICGAGATISVLVKKIEALGMKDKIQCICDNSSNLHDTYIGGIKVISFRQAYHKYKNSNYIVYNRFATDIATQLIKDGIEKIYYIRL